MKIAIVVPYFTPFLRGNEYGIAEWLSKSGADVTVLASKGKAPREKMILKNSEKSRPDIFKVKYLPTLWDVGEIPFTPTVFKEVLTGGYDALLLQEDYQLICHMAYLAARAKKIPTVLSTERSYRPDNSKRIFLDIFDATLNRVVRNGATAYTAHCRAAREFMQRELGVPEGRMSVIPIGVDTDFFKPTVGKSPLSDGRFKILTVARLHPYKGLNYLIEAMAMVKKDRPDIVLYIKGSGPQGSDLKALAHGKGLDETVRFVDMPLPYETMPAVYSSADAYVQPSVIEPFGCAVTEAMACGKPTICSRVGGMMDTVDDGETGYLVKPADPEELAGRIIELASDAGRARAMGERARSRAVEKFSWPVVSNQYSDLIRDITEKR